MGSGGHEWRRDSDGVTADQFAMDIELNGRGHNGPVCTVCKMSFCVHCYPQGWQYECPGPAPEGREWDWVGDAQGHPPATPELWPA
jgi:hypothetical protein